MEEKYRYAIMAYDKDADVYKNVGGYDPDYGFAVQKARGLAVAMKAGYLVRPCLFNGVYVWEPFDRIEVWDTEHNDECVFMDY